jgi:hypothetical protein
MHNSRPARTLLGILAIVLAATAVWLVLHNPTVESATLGQYTCAAPYDTVMNEADNVPGGEPPTDADQVEAACVDSGESLFTQGLIAGSAALVVAALAAVLFARSRSAATAAAAAEEASEARSSA